jgi:opacity protein-like surface antigen
VVLKDTEQRPPKTQTGVIYFLTENDELSFLKGGQIMWKKSLLVIGLIALMVAQVNAQSINFGPQVGYYKAKDADEAALMGGAALRLKLTSSLGIEGSINYRQEKYADGALTVKGWPIMATGLIYPIPIVYGAIGFGWYNVTLDYDQKKFPSLKDETMQKVGWHFGGGVELPLGSVLLTGDVRYVFLDYKFKQVPGSDKVKNNFTVFTAGLLFKL